jgi:hypothetical protein
MFSVGGMVQLYSFFIVSYLCIQITSSVGRVSVRICFEYDVQATPSQKDHSFDTGSSILCNMVLVGGMVHYTRVS